MIDPFVRRRSRGFAVGVTALVGLMLGAPQARAGDDAWLVVAESGLSRLHEDDLTAGGALRLSRDLTSGGHVRIQFGGVVTTYAALDAGVEIHPWPRAPLSLFLGAGAGLMAEDEYVGTFVRGTAGLEAKLAPRAVLRVTVQAGTHDGQAGPHLAAIGMGLRF